MLKPGRRRHRRLVYPVQDACPLRVMGRERWHSQTGFTGRYGTVTVQVSEEGCPRRSCVGRSQSVGRGQARPEPWQRFHDGTHQFSSQYPKSHRSSKIGHCINNRPRGPITES